MMVQATDFDDDQRGGDQREGPSGNQLKEEIHPFMKRGDSYPALLMSRWWVRADAEVLEDKLRKLAS